MSCNTCKWWQGTKYSKTADCYRVIGSIVPDIVECGYRDHDKRCDVKLELPFDPHDFSHWCTRSAKFNRLMKNIEDLPEGVTTEKVDGIEYYKTSAEFECDKYEGR